MCRRKVFLIFSPENVKGRWKDVREGGNVEQMKGHTVLVNKQQHHRMLPKFTYMAI